MKNSPPSSTQKSEDPPKSEPLELPTEDDSDEEGWILTYADMVTLLLVFFILLFSMSTIDTNRFSDSFSSVRHALGEGKGQTKGMAARIRTSEGAILESVMLQKQLIESQSRTFADMRAYMNSKGMEGIIGAVFDKGIITLDVEGKALFEKGEVELTAEGRALLFKLRDIFLQRKDQDIHIKGYTDDLLPEPGGRFKDNWEISALRAVNVLRFFLERGIEPTRLTATGLADLDPKFPNSSEENRAKNRRVEFSLERRIGK